MAEPDSPILQAWDEMRLAEQVLEAAQADFMVKREAWLILFEQVYGEEGQALREDVVTDPVLPEGTGP